jgi:hypothetical protein
MGLAAAGFAAGKLVGLSGLAAEVSSPAATRVLNATTTASTQ